MKLWSRIERRLNDLAGELVLDDYREQLAEAKQQLARGAAADAAADLEAIVRLKEDHGQAWILLGEARLALREPAAAFLAFERALALRGDDPAALVGLGAAQVGLGMFRESLAPLGRAIAEASGDRQVLAAAYYSMGCAWRRLGELDKAIRELRKAAAEDPSDADTRAALAEALVADGGPMDEARRHLDRATREQPAPATAELALGKMALKDDTPAIASGHFSRAKAACEADPTVLGKQWLLEAVLGLGDAALRAREAMAAHTCYLEALQLDPRNADVHARIAAAHRAIGSHDAALASYERALSLGGSLNVLREALDLAILTGDAARQTQWANDLLQRAPDDPRALVARGLGLAAAGQLEPARALLTLAAGKDDLDARFGLARLAIATDATAAAAQALAALRLSPHHTFGRRVLAEARAASFPALPVPCELDEAAAALERAVASRPDLGHLVGDVARATAALDQPLLVTVMGEFSSGKSSFINAFIGAEVAPTGITPTTATINVVRYGHERGGRIISRDGAVREVAWDALFSELRGLSPEAAKAIDRVEILVPLPQLERINIVDTPGLNSIQPEHEATARAFIARADAVVWVFTANQGGKASERKALGTIRDEGRRVLGVLNKADQLSASDLAEVTAFISQSLGDLVETVVPFSARNALAHKAIGAQDDGNWGELSSALETRFFAQARQLKRDACTRRLRAVIAEADTALEGARRRAEAASDAARRGRDALDESARAFLRTTLLAHRRALSEALSGLYHRAAREVLELVQPRRLPFSAHSATLADRDYVIALLGAGYDAALDDARRRFVDELTAMTALVHDAAAALTASAAADVREDLLRTARERIALATSHVFDRTRAYLHGFVDGGYVEAFFRNDVPRLELSEDAVYHALVRGAPEVDRDLAGALERATIEIVTAVSKRMDTWSGVVEIIELDDQLGVGRVLQDVSAQLGA